MVAMSTIRPAAMVSAAPPVWTRIGWIVMVDGAVLDERDVAAIGVDVDLEGNDGAVGGKVAFDVAIGVDAQQDVVTGEGVVEAAVGAIAAVIDSA